MRIKTYLKQTYPQFSQKKIKQLLMDQKVWINNKIAKIASLVSAKDEVNVDEVVDTKVLRPNPNLNCHLIKQTKNYIFFTKDAFVHSVAHDYDEVNTAANWLLSVDENLVSIGSPLESGLAHRLDYDTSGAMVAARNEEAFKHIKNSFRQKVVTKEYVCLTEKKPPKISLYQALAGKHPKSSKRILVQEKIKGEHQLNLIQTEILAYEQEGKFYRVRLRLVTGYRHQIRAHLAFMGMPIVGDKIYGGAKAERLMLHAHRIKFLDEEGKICEGVSKTPF